MKKALCALTALMLLLTGFAFAEAPADANVIESLSDTWVDDGASLEIWVDESDNAFHCQGVLGDGGDVNDTFEYGSCRYDAASESLICEGGVRTHDEGGEATATEGLTAVVFFDDGADRLIWSDSEGLAQGFRFQRLTDAEAEDAAEARAFAGRWGCGRATIDIAERDDDAYDVTITWSGSASEQSVWTYACAYDGPAKQMYSYAPGTKTIVTYAESGEAASTEIAYEDGSATFRIDADGMLTWEDARENAGEGMRFERSPASGTSVSTLIEDGGFTVRIPVAAGDEGWLADDMSQDDSVVKLSSAEIVDDAFVARYDPAGDGDMAVCVKHMSGIACDKAFTFDLRVAGGAVREVIGGSHAIAPADAELNPYIEGEWQVNDEVMAGMTVSKNDGSGWSAELRMAWPEQRVLKANIFYDCELDQFVYADGALYEYAIDSTPEGRIGDAIATDVSGSFQFKADGDSIELLWFDSRNPDASTRFYRPEGWNEKVITPMYAETDLSDCTCPVAFAPASLADGTLRDAQIYSEDCYDIVDIQQLAVGDIIVVSGETIHVTSLSDDEYGHRLVNGGYDAGGCTLCPYPEDNCWMCIEDDDFHTYTERAVVTLTLADDVTFTDGWDIERDPVTTTGIEAVTEAIRESDNDVFDCYNAEIRLEGGQIVEITRRYVP